MMKREHKNYPDFYWKISMKTQFWLLAQGEKECEEGSTRFLEFAKERASLSLGSTAVHIRNAAVATSCKVPCLRLFRVFRCKFTEKSGKVLELTVRNPQRMRRQPEKGRLKTLKFTLFCLFFVLFLLLFLLLLLLIFFHYYYYCYHCHYHI